MPSPMIRGLLRLIGYLFALAFASFILMGGWIVYDGIHDDFDHADVAVVPGYAEIKDSALASTLTARLDRAANLYAEGKYTSVIVSGVTPAGEDDETDAMAHYLEAKDVPANAIIQDHRGEKANDTIDNLARIMKDHRFHSVLLVFDYDRLEHVKLVLRHAGIREIEQAHVGEWKKEDSMDILKEDIAIYRDIYHWYVQPTAAEVSEKTSEEEKVLKDKVSTGLDSMHK